MFDARAVASRRPFPIWGVALGLLLGVNLLVVLTDAARNLIFVEGSVPGPAGGIVFVQDGRRPALADGDGVCEPLQRLL